MTLRPSLLPPPIAPAIMEPLVALALQIQETMDAGGKYHADLKKLLSQLPGEHSPDALATFIEDSIEPDFVEFFETSLRRGMLKPEALTREEITEMVEKIRDEELPEPDRHWFIELLEVSIPNPAVPELVLWVDREVPTAEIVEKICGGR